MIDVRPRTVLARIGRLFQPGLRCSFCGRDAREVERLVAGASAHICDACITQCVTVLEQHPLPRHLQDPNPATEATRS